MAHLTFSLSLRVDDPQQLYDAARQRLIDEGDADPDLGPRERPDLPACLIALLDPGHLPGCSIAGSEAAHEELA